MRWYISATAVKQWQAIAGHPVESDGPSFDRAERELAKLAEEARLAKDVGPDQQCQLWRVKTTARGQRTRLEFSVSLERRQEGDLPQLINVRNKGA